MEPYFVERYGNPSEITGWAARRARRSTRAHPGRRGTGAADKEIVFTSGGTEADNMALTGLLQRFEPGHLIISAIEHRP